MDKERSGERMKLGAFFHPTGNHVAAWLHPDAQIDAGTNFRHYAEIMQTAERGKFDLMFVAGAGRRATASSRHSAAGLVKFPLILWLGIVEIGRLRAFSSASASERPR
jgi:hypothetical protein